MNEELKNCPFCGAIAELVSLERRYTKYVVVKCLGCGASTKLFLDTEKGQKAATLVWNKRV